jgi:hypothetical protein
VHCAEFLFAETLLNYAEHVEYHARATCQPSLGILVLDVATGNALDTLAALDVAADVSPTNAFHNNASM